MGSRTVLVVGAMSHPGREAVAHFLQRRMSVRAMVKEEDNYEAHQLRRWGVELARSDFPWSSRDPDREQVIFRGVDSVFMGESGWDLSKEEQIRQEKEFLDSVRAAGVRTIFYLSAYNAKYSTGVPKWEVKREIEAYISDLGMDYVILAPVMLMEKLLEERTLAGIQKGCVELPIPGDRLVQRVAAEDVGALAGYLLENGEQFFGKRVEIVGDELSMEEEERMLSDYLGRTISYEQKREPGASEEIVSEWEWNCADGRISIMELVESFPEIDWHSFGAWLRMQDLSAMNRPAAYALELGAT